MASRSRLVLIGLSGGLSAVVLLLGWLPGAEPSPVVCLVDPDDSAAEPAPAADAGPSTETDEPRQEQRAVAKPKPLQLAIVREDLAEVPSAQVVIFRGEQVIADARCDAAGHAEVDSDTRGQEIAVVASGHAVFRGPIDASPGARTIVLPDEHLVHGRVLVDGSAPGEPIALSVRWRAPAIPTRALPTRVRWAFTPKLKTPGAISFATEPDGTFVLRGLPPEATGTFECDRSCYVEHERRDPNARTTESFDLQDGMTIRLGRVLQAQLHVAWLGGVPASGKVDYSFGSDVKGSGALVEGLFTVRLPRMLGPELELSIEPAGSPTQAFAQSWPVPLCVGNAWDLGTVRLDGLRTLTLSVGTSDGGLLSGLSVCVGDTLSRPQARQFNKDAQLLRLSVPVSVAALSLAARGYEPLSVPVPPDLDFVPVTMTRLARIDVTWPGVERGDRDLCVVLCDPGRDLQSCCVGSDDSREPGSATASVWFERPMNWKKHWFAENVPVDVPLRVDVRTAFSKLQRGDGQTLFSIGVPPLIRGEQRALALELPVEPRLPTLAISLPDGRPASSARVSVHSGSQITRFTAAADGRVSLGRVYGDALDLTVRVNGRAAETRNDVGLDAESLTIRLGAP